MQNHLINLAKISLAIIALILSACKDPAVSSTNAKIMNTAQINFTQNGKERFIYSTFLGTHCAKDAYLILSALPVPYTQGCELRHYFLIQVLGDELMGASANNKPASIQSIQKAALLRSFDLDQNAYLLTTPAYDGAILRLELLLGSGQFASLAQQILSKSLFFHQEDLSK